RYDSYISRSTSGAVSLSSFMIPLYPTPAPAGKFGRLRHLAQDEIADPAPAEVRLGGATVAQHLVVLAPGVLKCVGEDRPRADLPRLVHRAGECHRGVSAPRRVERDRPERVAEDVADQVGPGEFPPGS